jgi:hypothetical protein
MQSNTITNQLHPPQHQQEAGNSRDSSDKTFSGRKRSPSGRGFVFECQPGSGNTGSKREDGDEATCMIVS